MTETPLAVVCPVCTSDQTHAFFTQSDVPCQDGRVWATRAEAAAAPRGEIELVHCRACGHVFNRWFDASKMVFDATYNISLHHSPAYAAFIEELVRGLVDRHDLRNKTVVEIGCGKADFLKAVCLPYGNRGEGFDPTFTDDCLTEADRKLIRVTPDYYTPASGVTGDLVTFRSMLQYMTQPRAFLQSVRPAVKASGGVVYAEVPNSAHVFEKLSIWNIVYEHGCFYSRTSLTKLFEDCDFAVQDCFSCWVEDQNLGIEAGLTQGSRAYAFDPAEVERFSCVIDRFDHDHEHKKAYWRHTLDRLQTQGKRMVMWGAGARAQSFCTTFDLDDVAVPYIVDINPQRQGCFMPKTLQTVVPPETLKVEEPDVVLITNSGYAEEIKKQIRTMGVRCEVMVLD